MPDISPMPKWLRAKEFMRDAIMKGQFGVEGSPFLPVRELAIRCGVSLVTAQKVMTLLKDEGLVARKGKAYIVNANGASAFRRIGVIATMPDNPFFSMLTKHIEATASKLNLGTVVAYSSYDVEKEGEIVSMFMRDGMLGVLACPADVKLSIRNFRKCAAPHVFIGRKIEGYEADAVLVQNFSAGRAVALHLAKRQAKSFAYLGIKNFACDPRLQGFRSGLAELGLQLPGNATLYADNMDLEAAMPDLRRLLKELPKPLAFFCFHDLLAARALRAANSLGLKIPEEVSIVGFDNLPIALELTPSLSSVAYPLAQMAELAVESLLRRANGGTEAPRVNYLEPSLVERESSGGPAARSNSLNAEALAFSMA